MKDIGAYLNVYISICNFLHFFRSHHTLSLPYTVFPCPGCPIQSEHYIGSESYTHISASGVDAGTSSSLATLTEIHTEHKTHKLLPFPCRHLPASKYCIYSLKKHKYQLCIVSPLNIKVTLGYK